MIGGDINVVANDSNGLALGGREAKSSKVDPTSAAERHKKYIPFSSHLNLIFIV